MPTSSKMSGITKEDLLPKILTLKADRSNWLMFKNRVEWATEAKGLVEYLEGTKTKPANPSEGKDALWKPTAEGEKVAVAEFLAKYAKWRQENGYISKLTPPCTRSYRSVQNHRLYSKVPTITELARVVQDNYPLPSNVVG